MKKLVLAVLLVLMCGTVLFAADLPKMEEPVLIMAVGQSQDGSFVQLLGKRVKLSQTYSPAITADEIDWASIKTIIAVIGGSGKGLGSAGLNITDEQKRVDKVFAEAKAHGVKILGMHIGGEDRRGSNSVPFLPYAEQCDALVIKEDGNKDGYFTEIANRLGIPMTTITATSELTNILKAVFK
jgi:hypothetical protein